MITYMYKTICITSRNLVSGDFLEQIERVAKTKPYAIILREKDLPENDYTILAEKVHKICNNHNVMLILHKYIDSAKKLGIKNIHLPMNDLINMGEEDKKFFDIIGASTHSVQQAKFAETFGADYVTISHIFATDCKKGLEPKGLSLIRNVKRAVNIDVYALGGINKDNIKECIEYGADGVCIMSGFMKNKL